MKALLVILFSCALLSPVRAQQVLETRKGTVSFLSEAPLETIRASSQELNGVIDLSTKGFAFTVEVQSFEGFNSALQREHFNENYMESDRYPKATFIGKLIDPFDPSSPDQSIRVKGKFEVHGIPQERIITVRLVKSGATYQLSADFNVHISDHGIIIPKIVHQKIAEIIKISVKAEVRYRS